MTAISFSETDGFGRITLSAPPVNGFTLEFMRELDDAIEAARDSGVGAVVLESDIDGMFSAGGDLQWYTGADETTLRNFVSFMHKTFRTLERIPAVTIAALDGHCLAGGFELALACDVRIASDGPWEFGCVETEIGAIPGGGGTQRLSRELGRGDTIDMLVNARRLSPETAEELGLVQHVVPTDEVESEVADYATRIVEGPTRAYAAVTEAVNEGVEMSLDEGLAYEQALEFDLFGTEDFAEGLDAFLEDREPAFQGK